MSLPRRSNGVTVVGIHDIELVPCTNPVCIRNPETRARLVLDWSQETHLLLEVLRHLQLLGFLMLFWHFLT